MEIKFENVTYKENIKTPLEKTHLKNINLTIKEKTITSILGDSSSGKTYIGELINASITPTFGSVKVLDFINSGRRIKDINTLRMNVGYVKMNPNTMLFNKTVKKELEFGIKYFKYKTDKKEIRCLDALKLIGLDKEYLNKKITDLNLIEKKKISLASVLVFNPKVIILDEPTIGLGTKEKEELKSLITILKEKYKKTIILLTSDTNFAYGITDETIILYKGNKISQGGKTLIEDITLLETYNLHVPEIIKFISSSNKKGVELTKTDNILDLIKEVYRNAK